MKTSWEKITVDNSPMGMYLAQPDAAGPVPAIIVVQNQDGVAEFTQEMTRRVAAAGYVGIAPQFYHREGEPKTPEATASIKNSRNDANVINDINATVSFLKGCTCGHLRLGPSAFAGHISPFSAQRPRYLRRGGFAAVAIRGDHLTPALGGQCQLSGPRPLGDG
jgi:carboxymethylenebutenolidase